MNRLLAIIILLISAAGANVALADTRTPLWETVEVHDEVPGSVNDPIEVETRDKKIYISCLPVCLFKAGIAQHPFL